MTRLESLENYLRAGAGRCRSCGHHPATQGHAPHCKRRRDPIRTPNNGPGATMQTPAATKGTE